MPIARRRLAAASTSAVRLRGRVDDQVAWISILLDDAPGQTRARMDSGCSMHPDLVGSWSALGRGLCPTGHTASGTGEADVVLRVLVVMGGPRPEQRHYRTGSNRGRLGQNRKDPSSRHRSDGGEGRPKDVFGARSDGPVVRRAIPGLPRVLPRGPELGGVFLDYPAEYPAITPRLLHLVRTALGCASGGFLEQTRGKAKALHGNSTTQRSSPWSQRSTLDRLTIRHPGEDLQHPLLRAAPSGPRRDEVLRRPSRPSPSPSTSSNRCCCIPRCPSSSEMPSSASWSHGPSMTVVGALDGRSGRRAAPGLRRSAWPLAQLCPDKTADVESEMLATFVEAVRRVDRRPPAAGRSSDLAGPWRGEGTGASRDGRVGQAGLPARLGCPAAPVGPSRLRAGQGRRRGRALCRRCRADRSDPDGRLSLEVAADRLGITYAAARKRRIRAEAALVAWITSDDYLVVRLCPKETAKTPRSLGADRPRRGRPRERRPEQRRSTLPTRR